jgi:hypothetical protein
MSNKKHCIDLLNDRLKLIESLQKLICESQIHYQEKRLIENEITLRNHLSKQFINYIFNTPHSYVVTQQQINNIKNVIQILNK